MKIHNLLAAASLLLTPLMSFAQTTVFSDSFVNGSTLNPTAASPGTLTANRTAYQIASSKSATATAITSGALTFGNFSTSSGYCEGQALFTATPVTLSAAGQYIEVYYTFTDTTTLFNGNASDNEQISIGLYNSGNSAPTNGIMLWNSGLASSVITATNGGAKGWVGYCGMIAYTKTTAAQASAIYTRPAQTGTNNLNQGLCPVSGYSGATNLKQISGITNGQPQLTVGNQYTLALKLTYVSPTSIELTETLYNGTGIGGSIYSTNASSTTFTANLDGTATPNTFTFDGLCIGFRPTSSPTTAETMQINNVTVIDYIPALPNITGLTNQTVVAGTSPTLAPTISGVPTPSYQWQTNGVNIPGATSASLPLSNVQTAQNGYVYSLIASNLVGLVTNSMTLTVIAAPSITGLGNQAGSIGSTINFSPTVTGTPTPTMLWFANGVLLTDGVDANGSTISGSATSNLSIANAQAADSGTYTLIASNVAGSATNSLTLTVSGGNVLPTITGPVNQTVVQNNNATFTASVSGLPTPTLQWLDQTGTPIPGATTVTLTVNSVTYSQNGFTYSLVANNVVGSVTNSATLTVLVPPTITIQPTSLTVTNTQAASFTVTATGAPNPTYQWFANGSPISSASNATATNANLMIASATPANSGTSYYVQISNSGGTTNSATVTLTVNSAMAVAALTPANGATGICYDTQLYLNFSQTPTLHAAGTIKIFNVNNSVTPVDTIDLSQCVTPNANAKNVQPRQIGGDSFTNYPVIITGTQAAIYPHLGVLTSNQTYYVTVDTGTFTDAAGANFTGITATNVWQFTTKPTGPANPVNLLVAADGTGDFVTVQGAIDFVPSGNTTPRLISINNGNYVEIVNVKAKHNLTLRGQSRNGTILGYANNANLQGSTHYRMAMKINANDIALDNLTLTNRTPAGGSQAEALMLESNAKRFIFNNCNLGSFQDTLLANGGGQAQAYFNNSLITGQFDYIWGGGVIFFTNCELRTVYGSGSSWNLVASRTDTSAGGTWPGFNGVGSSNGFSFVNCYLSKVPGVGIGNPTLADSNGTTNGVAAWINCRIQKDYVAPSAAVINSELLWEFGNTNNDTGNPVTYGLNSLTTSDARYLAAASATNWLYAWQPQLTPNILTNPASQTVNFGSPATFTVAATGIPDPTYQWQLNGTNLPGATSATFALPSVALTDAGNYSVVVTTLAGSVTSSPAVLVVNPPLNTAPVFTGPISGTNFAINAGMNLAVACTGSDADLPSQTLSYSLLSGPTGAAINAASGNFTWRPTVAQANSTNAVTVVVTDSGTPNLSATNHFTVMVNALTLPSIAFATLPNGQFNLTVTGQTGPDYAVQISTNLQADWITLYTTNTPVLPFTFTDTIGTLPAQFYRVQVGP